MPAASEGVTVSEPKDKKPRRRRVKLLAGLAVVVVAGIFWATRSGVTDQLREPVQREPEPVVLTLKDRQFTVSVADNALKRNKGLSGTESLGEDKGMLFVFDFSAQQCMWMKDMNYNIDILWFDEERKLVYQVRDVSPETYPASFCSQDPALYVLELPSGTASELGVSSGDTFVSDNL
jgi:uncharacterized protein